MDPSTAKPAQKRRRQRSPSPPAPRKKSCKACRKSKARCNTALPACSQCQRKGIPCDYEGTRNEDRPSTQDDAPMDMLTISAADFAQVDMMLEDPDAPFSLSPFKGAHVIALPVDSTGIPVATGATIERDQQNRNTQDSPDNSNRGSSSVGGPGYQTGDTDFTPDGMQDIAIDPGLANDPYSIDPVPTHTDPQDGGVRQLPFHMITTFREDGSKQIEVYPNENGEEYNPRFFGFNNEWSPACTLSANRVIGAFKLWPKRMVRGDDLPPFIHPHFPGMRVSPIGTMTKKPLGRMYFGQPPKLPEALAICSSICTMFYNKTPENTGFVWKNIKREQERIYENFKKWDSRDCLSAYQSMLIYSFCRMIDGEHEHNNFDMAFILTMGEVSAGLWSREMIELQHRLRDPEDITWQDWIVSECLARTGIVFMFIFIMLGLYKVIPPTKGCSGLDGMPLPCGRRLWNARDQDEWEEEYRAYRESRKTERPMTFGDLSMMRNNSDYQMSPELRADIEAWAADLDEFGNLVLIGALAGPGDQLDDYRRRHILVDDNVA